MPPGSPAEAYGSLIHDMPKRSASPLTPGRRHGQMNHSYKTCLLLFSPSFHSAVASAAKFSRHSPSQHTSFQRSPPTYLRMPFTKRASYFTHCFSDFLRRYLFQLRRANRRAVAKILVQVSRKPLDSPDAQLNLHRARVRRNPPPFTPHRQLFGNPMRCTLLPQRLPYCEVRGDSCPLWPRP